MRTDTISLKECIDWMNLGLLFSFKCVSYDEKRPKKSGKWIEVGEAVGYVGRENEEIGRDIDTPQETDALGASDSESAPKKSKDPHHRSHFTRNIRLCVGRKPVGKPLKIHLDLLTRFNGKKVILP